MLSFDNLNTCRLITIPSSTKTHILPSHLIQTSAGLNPNKKIITATIFLARDYACYIAEPPIQSESPREIPSNILSPFIDKSC